MNDIPRYIGGSFESSLPTLENNDNKAFIDSIENLRNVHYLGSARGAWSMLLNFLERQGGRVLLPDYLCSRALMPPLFKRDLSYSFYPVNSDLTIDLEALEKMIQKDVSAILFINYFGFTSHDSIGWALRKKFPELILLLDNVQAFFDIKNEPMQTHWAHARYFGFRKFLPLPDGAILISNLDLTKTTPHLNKAPDIAPYLTAAHLRNHFVWNKLDPEIENTIESTYLHLFQKADDEIPEQPTEMSSFSRMLIKRLPLHDFAKKRRDNYHYLTDALSENKDCNVLKKKLNAKEVPLTLPIIIKNQKRNEIRKKMSDSGVYCPFHWPIEFHLRNSLGKNTLYLTDHILGLPVDQRYGYKEMDRILETLNKALET